jgi:IS30 family transposase
MEERHPSARYGEEHAQSKLDWETVRYIRHSTESARSIARRLGVAHGTVGAARRCETWRGLEDSK